MANWETLSGEKLYLSVPVLAFGNPSDPLQGSVLSPPLPQSPSCLSSEPSLNLAGWVPTDVGLCSYIGKNNQVQIKPTKKNETKQKNTQTFDGWLTVQNKVFSL